MPANTNLPPINIPARQWAQVDWFTPGPFPWAITRTYCNAGGTGTVKWRYITTGYAEGTFSECAQITIVGSFYISVEMYSEEETVISRA